ncbi:MAG: DNA repair protein RadC [Holosporaceae bacterium]|jgi:DNA repair protein RadC|nr:DNA repair protein RadC [Holosporaceae bacterium]
MSKEKHSDEKPHYLGHRQRLRKKFAQHPTRLSDYELLELLLFYVFARKDTKPLAKRILEQFKTLREAIFANVFDLKKVKDMGESSTYLFLLMREIFSRVLLEKIQEPISIISTSQVLDYYKSLLEQQKKEQFRIMFLNNKNKLIAEELMYEGTVNSTAIYPREIVQKALNYGASAIIMVHNHPGGDPKPSRQDIIMTRAVKEIVQKLDIVLLDHIIIGTNSTTSLHEMAII